MPKHSDNRRLRNAYALEIAQLLGWKQLKGEPNLWSNGKYNPKTTTEVIRRHRSTEFLMEQIKSRELPKEVMFYMLSDNVDARTNVLKAILDDIKKE